MKVGDKVIIKGELPLVIYDDKKNVIIENDSFVGYVSEIKKGVVTKILIKNAKFPTGQEIISAIGLAIKIWTIIDEFLEIIWPDIKKWWNRFKKKNV